jgi:uncharacterized protein YkwD
VRIVLSTRVALATTLVLCAPGSAHAAALACQGADTLPGQSSGAIVRSATLCLMNSERATQGLAGLRAQPALASAASRYAREMVSERFFAHTSPRGSTVLSRIRDTAYLRGAPAWTVGENIASGSGTMATPRAIVEAWMESPGHRANLLSPCFRDVGIGMAAGMAAQVADAGGAGTYVTDFGRRSTRRCTEGSARAAH